MWSKEQLAKVKIGNKDSGFLSGEKSTAEMELCESFARNLTLRHSNIDDIQSMGQRVTKTGDKLKVRRNDVRNNIDTLNRSCDFYFRQDSEGDTQLHVAIIMKYLEASLWLITMASNSNFLDIVNDEGQTPLHLAVLTGEPRIVRMLILAGANANNRLQSGNTALHLACSLGDMESVKALTDPITEAETSWLAKNLRFSSISAVNFDLELKNNVGQTCLHLAASKGKVEIVKHLLLLGANVYAREGLAGRTALHLAVENNCLEIIHFLGQEHRSCLDTVSYSGKTAYQIAVDYKPQIANDLLVLGATPDLRSIDVDRTSNSSLDDDVDNCIPICTKVWEQNTTLVLV